MVPRERVQQRTAEKIGDVPQFRKEPEERLETVTWVPRERVQHRTAEKKEVAAPHLPEETVEAVRRSRCSYSMIGNVPSHHFPDDQRVFFWRRTMKVCPLPPPHWRYHLSSPSNKRLAENESSVLNLWNLRNRTRRCAGAAARWQVRSNVPGVKQLLLRTQPQIWELVHFFPRPTSQISMSGVN